LKVKIGQIFAYPYPYTGYPELCVSVFFGTLDKGSHVGSAKTKSGTKSRTGQRLLLDTYTRRRQIAQRLLAAEIERFTIWLKPRGGEEYDDSRDTEEEKQLKLKFKHFQDNYSLEKLTERNWKDIARAAWRVSPHLACHLPSRLKQEEFSILLLKAIVKNFKTHQPRIFGQTFCLFNHKKYEIIFGKIWPNTGFFWVDEFRP